MIKKMTVCVCDVCGRTEAAFPVGSQYNETYYAHPPGWKSGERREIDICPDCAGKIDGAGGGISDAAGSGRRGA